MSAREDFIDVVGVDPHRSPVQQEEQPIMSTKTVTVIDGDLLDVTEGIIAHQVNCYGVMGAGVALAIARRYPRVESRYRELCREVTPEALLGHAQLVLNATPEHPVEVANLFGQLTPGPATDYDAVRDALSLLADTAIVIGYFGPLHVPYLMGCGIGGGDWDTYSAILCEEWPGEVIAHRLVP